ncbi:hypothetical protein [Zavarzinella formosa]|uniref:hypothetical protein n=1 Tax=Zavarzinella formosa TaxID=360055 RepID=UPI0003616C06|nr:hypothetical protein [Zavarzinella formosa]
MTRFLSLAVLLILTAVSHAQFMIRLHPPSAAPRPAGVIPPPAVPISGQPFGRTVPAVNSAPYLSFNPWGFYSGYPAFYPSWQEPDNPGMVINNFYNVPAPPPVVMPPKPAPLPVEMKAQLILNVPRGAEVIVSGKKLDSAIRPLVVFSPDLKPGERFLFDVKVTWREGDKSEERTRQLQLEAGDEKSLSFFPGR